ncbi:hypothetical protein [Poritiphilus flavus]|uniref:DUF3244 domain-containing protein n=1 Tax=Poritiphilus flavus TaxID=2697053 RepID=A0A6L9EFP0_9FLAO|nr:hypothetical protein [Poritiphilus flavus]NAS13318.1 hypothetical protein [Poritiphilus flavus]
MKAKFKRVFSLALVFLGLALFNPAQATEKKDDPRIQVEDNLVRLWFLNQERSSLFVKIYDDQSNVIRKVNLGDELTVGKVLDFNQSEKAYYRLVIMADKDVLFDTKIRVGSH